MTSSLIIHPEYLALQEELKRLQEQLSQLFHDRDMLLCHICPDIQVDYVLKIGHLEYKVYELDCEVAELRRKFQLIMVYVNRQESFDLDEIEAQLAREFEEYAQTIQQHIDEVLAASAYHNNVKYLSLDDAAELKKLYRQIIKLLHPDLHPDTTEREKRIFEQAYAAYKNGDLAEMRVLILLLEDIRPIETFENYEELYAKVVNLRVKCTEMESEIEGIKNSFPYDQKDFLADATLVAERTKELEGQIEDLRELCQEYQTMIQQLTGL